MLFIIVISSLAICLACRNPSIGRDAHITTLVAWNEDSVNSVKLVLYKGNEFYYDIAAQSKEPKHFTGHYKMINDTIFLTYLHNNRPEGFTDYIIKEVSGGYLIQHYAGNRMFLRLQRFGAHR